MRRILLVALAAVPLAACEFDTSPEHAAYCASGGFWGCGHGTRMVAPAVGGMAAGAVAAEAARPQPTYQPMPVSCTSSRFGNTVQTTCN